MNIDSKAKRKRLARYLIYGMCFTFLIWKISLGKESDGPRKNKKTVVVRFERSDTMDVNEFWKIVDYTAGTSTDKSEQARLLTEKLTEYSPAQIIEFERIFRKYLDAANDYKVMGAEKVIEGYVSDDSYIYFRCWVISCGRKAFEQALKNPDSLAGLINKSADGFYRETYTQFEPFLYVTTNGYSNKTGKAKEDDGFPRNVVEAEGLRYNNSFAKTKGTDWTEEKLPGLYPKLWALFH